MTTPLLPVLAILVAAPPPASTAQPGPGGGGRLMGGAGLVERASQDMEKIRRALKEILARVQDARDERDLVKLLCADEKLSRLKRLVAVAERADVALAEAASAADEAAMIESSKIAIARGKADALRAEAAACIGQLAFETSERTLVVVEEAQALPEIGHAGADPLGSQDPYRIDFGLPSAAHDR